MKGKMKKVASIALAACTVAALSSGCSSNAVTKSAASSKSSSNVTLTIMSNMTGASNTALADTCKSFTKKTGIKIEYSAPSNDYGTLMKTKMASGDLPDVFSTHGWSVSLYSPYLRSLNDQPWAKNISTLIKPQITDKDGKVYVLPIDQDVAGIVYNVDVINQCGIDVDSLKTWADFEAACDKVKAKGITPVAMGNKDTWTVGQFFDWVAPSIYVTDSKNNEKSSLTNHTFSWDKWATILNMFKSWQTKGYLNKDVLTSDYNTVTAQLGQGKVAFEMFGNSAISDARKANPKANIGMMPIPAYYNDDTPTLNSGEHLAMGVWKDTTHQTESLNFISYLATSSVMSHLATVNGMLPGLSNVKASLGTTQQYYDKYGKVRTMAYFDRLYLPTGMWDDWCLTGANILAGKSIASQTAYLESSYKTKLSQAS